MVGNAPGARKRSTRAWKRKPRPRGGEGQEAFLAKEAGGWGPRFGTDPGFSRMFVVSSRTGRTRPAQDPMANRLPPSAISCHSASAVATLAAMDKLEEIFRMQDALNRRIGVNLPPSTDEEKAKWILNYTRAMQQETAELIDSVPWKWWAKYQKFDEQNAKVEVVDLFHFLVSLAQTLGMTPDDVYQAYLKKNAVNHARQESGYVKKDESDSKHI